jgi:outer membrane protein assembly factor BamA
MEVQDTDTIQSIKKKISEIHGIPHDRQKIEFFGKKSDDYNIQSIKNTQMKLTILFNIDLDKRAYFKSGDVSGIHKLEEAKLASTGDSAKALVVSCLSLAISLFLA